MKILMVCLGNICRSPLAEGILRDKVDSRGLDWEIDSAGTSGWHSGDRPHEEAIQIGRAHGVDIMGQQSRIFVVEDFDQFDIIFAMDSSNYQDIVRLARNEDDKQKVELILNYAYPGRNKAVPDPYYEGGFGYVYDELEKAIEVFVEGKKSKG